MSLVELQQRFIREVLAGVDGAWDRIEVHFEYYVWKGDVLRQSTSVSFLDGKESDVDLSFDAFELMCELRNAKPEGQAEHWTSMDFRIDSTGKFTFDHGYGVPPMAARTIEAQDARS
ncbi:hypothetical protein FGE12_13080 [Aggregicoccus sp. 17bor-14]|uniref:hypothetical protein n=1 Tax=Myxococcaceae TaxID=31 RepID=UPI00129CAE86|nr:MULTISPECIES: hypothetical protein [Myxococcaceae]MBF5043324.1 hypothetical protein [Simulacricoccus sp. 17bor-14]MRI89083.1 hypothetical protein [Aggregicoccus sp. 17bor-14]